MLNREELEQIKNIVNIARGEWNLRANDHALVLSEEQSNFLYLRWGDAKDALALIDRELDDLSPVQNGDNCMVVVIGDTFTPDEFVTARTYDAVWDRSYFMDMWWYDDASDDWQRWLARQPKQGMRFVSSPDEMLEGVEHATMQDLTPRYLHDWKQAHFSPMSYGGYRLEG